MDSETKIATHASVLTRISIVYVEQATQFTQEGGNTQRTWE